MEFAIILVGIAFSMLSTLILSYVSVATMVGPWIAPMLVLLGHMLSSCMKKGSPTKVACMQAIGAGGGIIATGVGFALPMLYFLDEKTFAWWLESGWRFTIALFALCITAGGFGLWLGRRWSKNFLDEQLLPFPVSNLTHKIITSPSHPQQARCLIGSIGITMFICFLRDGIGSIANTLAKTYYLFPSLLGSHAAFSIWPSLWSIGFTVGTSITLPLLVGLIGKYIVVYPLAQHANYLPFKLFDPISPDTFVIAFCSGLVLCELILHIPYYVKSALVWLRNSARILNDTQGERKKNHFNLSQLTSKELFELGLIMVSTVGLLSYCGMNPLAQALFILFTCIATYSINQIGGKIGMIPFGRYSTFIVVPLLLLFNLTPVQATVTCVFFNICAASASDLLFDYKTAQLCNIDKKTMYRYQWIGLIATSCFIGLVLWLLFTHLQLGSETFFAQRGKAKALLLQSLNFDPSIVCIGIAFGWLLKKIKINPTMAFGGLIMPNSVSIGLIGGSLGTLLTKTPEQLQPLCAGALAAESLWILITIMAKMA